MNKEELMENHLKLLNSKLNQAKIDYMTTTSEYRKRDIKKFIKKLEKEIKNEKQRINKTMLTSTI